MPASRHQPPKPRSGATRDAALRVIAVLALLYLFLVGINGLGAGFKLLGKDLLGSFFAATENPFAALVVGILATTLVQSSSVTTSMIVAMVAAPENPLPLTNAIPMIMGANIGTTVTNTVVSLAHMTRKEEFERAFSVATCHDFFNFLSVMILLPLEMGTGLLSRVAVAIGSNLGDVGGVSYKSPFKVAIKTTVKPVLALAEALFDSKVGQATIVVVISGGMIFVCLFMIVKLLRAVMRTRVEVYISRALGRHAVISMVIGMVATVLVQSSSITTSLLVPLAGAGLLTLERAFPITLGANIGTTITALLASLAVSGANAAAGIEIALCHLMFNLVGILIIYPIPAVRRLPLAAARWLAATAVRSKALAVAYVVGLFYGLPAILIFLSQAF